MFGRAIPNMLASPKLAHDVHRELFRSFGFGDNPSSRPEDEGQNGFVQFAMLCSRFGIPLTTLIAPSMKDASSVDLSSEWTTVPPPQRSTRARPGLLGVRVGRTAWKPPLKLRHEGVTYLAQGCFLGSEFCSHQTALAMPGCADTLSFYDSDATALGIGPLTWGVSPSWWEDFEFVLPFSNETQRTRFCDFSPHNRHAMAVIRDTFRAHGEARPVDGSLQGKEDRLVNCDWVYAAARD
tara:strand:- start:265 stop:978 length:714 start_codon:yes stop_codon:yes gene_type:complete